MRYTLENRKGGRLIDRPEFKTKPQPVTFLGKDKVSAPFSYASRLTETILLGVIAGRFPNKTLHWDNAKARFKEEEANAYLSGTYRNF